jgi:serine/threonine protein phosphatase PrpC
MGTTIVAALVAGARVSVGHVGDSRFYLFADGRLRQLTHDDSWVASVLVHNPNVDPIVVEQHPMRNALTNVVGGRPRTEVHIVEETLTGAELLLLTTDGVHGVLDDRRLEQLLEEGNDLPETAAAILDAALTRGSRDNCTAIVARYHPD